METVSRERFVSMVEAGEAKVYDDSLCLHPHWVRVTVPDGEDQWIPVEVRE